MYDDTEHKVIVSRPSFAVSPPFVQQTLEQAKEQQSQLRDFCFSILKEGTDYGVIPGIDKKVLHKPGAEKLCQFLRLYPRFEPKSIVENFEKSFFFYRYECQLIHINSGNIIGTGIGSCNSKETKYRYRNASRKCPVCAQEAIIKGHKDFGGGWLCWKKKNGCGAKFKDDDQTITEQEVGRIENPDICDQVNTLDKMAQKRSLMAAILVAAGVSEYFTQDLEDAEGAPKESPAIPVSVEKETPKESPSDFIPRDYDITKSMLKIALKQLAQEFPNFTELEYFRDLIEKDKAEMHHIDSAHTSSQMRALEKALEKAEIILKEKRDAKANI